MEIESEPYSGDSLETKMKQNEKYMTCDAVLFDLDGVLIDSTSCIVRHWQCWAEKHGLDLNRIMQTAHGMRTIETIRQVAPHLDAQVEAEQFTAHEVADTQGVVTLEGAVQTLEGLPTDTWAIVTSASSDLAKVRLLRAGLPIPDVLVSADQVKRGKPDPEPYLAGAKRLSVPVERCVVIEDAPAGVAAGRNAGMRVIGVKTTHSSEALLEAGAEIVVDRLSHLDFRQATSACRLAICVQGKTQGDRM